MTYIKIIFRTTVISLLLLVTPLVASSKSPVESDIVEQTSDPSSENYYPNLQLRFWMGDKTLTEDNFHYLYYGFTYQDAYRPLEVNSSMDKVMLLASALNPAAPNVASLDSLIIAVNQALEFNPFSPQLWNLLSFAYGALGDTTREEQSYDRVVRILQTIENSGDGAKKGTPKHIIMFDHAIDYLSSLSIAHSSARVVDREVEYIPFQDEQIIDGRKYKGIFFNYSRIYAQRPADYEHKRSRSWQLNNLKPWPRD